MEIHDERFISDKATAVALGFFDGVHLGHQEIIKETVDAGKIGLQSVVFSFKQNPKSFLTYTDDTCITDNQQKQNILSSMGVSHFVMANFNKVKDISYEEFIYNYLMKQLKAKMLFCGIDFTFGAKGYGNVEKLIDICKRCNIEVVVIEPIKFNDEIVSSTKIKKCIESGLIETANKMLGRYLLFNLPIVHGNGMGKLWGFPTANQIMPKNCVCPKYGVYFSRVSFDGYSTYAITNLGVKPTIGSKQIIIESHIPFYKGENFYGKYMTTELINFIRPECKFSDIESLKEQIHKDVLTFNELYLGQHRTIYD